jgi:hypothetical protein
LPKKWLGWTRNVIATVTSVGRDKVGMYMKSKALADKTLREQKKRGDKSKNVRKLALESAKEEP